MKKVLTILILTLLLTTRIYSQTNTNSSYSNINTLNSAILPTITTTIVTTVNEIPFTFMLYHNGEPVEDNSVLTDPDWNLRDSENPVSLDFSLMCKGDQLSSETLEVLITVDKLSRVSADSTPYVIPTLTIKKVGSNLGSMVQSLTDFVESDTESGKSISTDLTLKKNASISKMEEVFAFNVEYGTDENAPAGQYESKLTFNYTVM